MRRDSASSTARLIARATLLLAEDERTRALVPPDVARLSALLLAGLPGGKKDLRRLKNRWYRRAAWIAERATIPGLFVHFAARKGAIEDAVRVAVANGVRQVVVLGAGFDTLAARLHTEFPGVRFFELDHPATQAPKRRALEAAGIAGGNLAFVPVDLQSATPEDALRAAPGFGPEEASIVVVEGVLMYLAAEGVERTLRGLRRALGHGSTLVLTFMARRPDGRIRFTSQSWLASRWLQNRKEPFLWSSDPAGLAALLERCGFLLAGTPAEPRPADGFRAAGGELLAQARVDDGIWLNDVQTRLHPTRVREVVRPRSTREVQDAVVGAARQGRPLSISGGRHAQGGQQFAKDATHLDLTEMRRILSLDRGRGIVHAEAGIQWPTLIQGLAALQSGDPHPWGIVQKQTGADQMSLGGALAANIHGRGLALGPIIQDVEAFLLVDANGEARRCSRTENPELFRLAIGGYGLFGAVTEVWLRLRRRTTLQRVVEVVSADALMDAMRKRVEAGFLYGDFQYATDPASDEFLRRGLFSCYRPAHGQPPPAGQRRLSQEDWDRLVRLAHHDRAAAFRHYCDYYLATDGQFYDSDEHQLTTYLEDYHQRLDAATGSTPACEVISELFVPRDRLGAFLADLRAHFRTTGEAPIYGTIRLIEKDEESFLSWAREPWACTIVNLHVEHSADAVRRAQQAFRSLFDIALGHGGSFYLTYHGWATREQLERAYPKFRAFLSAKRRHDPAGRFQSEWYRHMQALFND